ncbi:peptidoglycan/xylan/chitin deacetylase (PgdA/CDA1 family) [Scopulibacillus daqui]|uniref:Peptidoglycan/xylan/chitin deacetylase (PgdA/CDA1 family) n=2 Tax=Scopulibacillus daqui TaxID=1469162 RepID=A0ABS2PV20_9BACL|nr:peptidoglycan/xylan/chitin deacetylase (PgdA/CDA1 family) [Scopulibacillus daqui]
MGKGRKMLKWREVAILTVAALVIFIVGFANFGDRDVSAEAKNMGPPKKAVALEQASELKKQIKGSNLGRSIDEKASKQAHEKVVYLTFDDGPSPDVNKLMDTLNKYHAKATFFMLAPNIKKHPEAVKRMAKEGFGLGLHGVTHDPNKFYRSGKSALHEMEQDQKVLEDITGIKTHMVRTPYGSFPYLRESDRSLMESHGFKIWDWDIDSEDWELKSRQYVPKVINSLNSIEKAGRTPVILLHDHENSATLKYLPELLSYLKQHHYKMKSLDDSMKPVTFQCHNRCYAYSQKHKSNR